MNETNFDWDDLRLFLAVARAGGLSGAATVTGKSAATLGRRMLALEAATSQELFRRQARGYELTEQGTALLARAVDLEAQIQAVNGSAAGAGRVLVKISAGSWMTHILCRKADVILAGNDATRLRFISAEHVLDIAHREAVIGIRNQRPAQAGLVCRRVGQVRFAGYAIDTGKRPWVRVIGQTPTAQWLAANAPTDAIEVTAPRNALDLAGAGVACALLPTFVGDAAAGLMRVGAIIPELTHDQWVVTHHEERFRPEVRRTIDRIYKVVRSLHA